jgi:hydroxypyruvate isomerase
MLRFSTSVNFLFGELPFLERFAAASAAGLAGVEIQFIEAEPAEIRRAVDDAGVEVVLINVDMGDLMAGGPGLSGVPGREREFREAAARAAQAADILGARCVHLGPSLVPEGVSREDCLASYRSNVEAVLALDAFASGGVKPLLEPMNTVDMPNALFSDVQEAAAWLQCEFAGALGLQFDIYHVAQSGLDPLAAWHALAGQVSHVQFSDAPGRGEPGRGDIDFPAVFRAIGDSSYGGWTGAEYFPSGATLNTLGWLHDYA